MDGRRGGGRTLLPLRRNRQLSNSVSCWYCDVKFRAFNDPLFRFGRRYSRYLRAWFSIGVGFSLAALFGVTVIILYELARATLVYTGNARPGNSMFGFPFLFCGVCALALFLLPFILSPLYRHGDSPMVLDVHPMSPLSGYLSPYDVVHSLNEFHIHTAEEWRQIITVLTEQTSGQSSRIENLPKSYCVPHSLIEESKHTQFDGHQTYCPDELVAFAPIACLNVSSYYDGGNQTYLQKGEVVHCLNAKDVVKFRKCAYNGAQAPKNDSGCLCSEEELCLSPLQLPALGWIEITYSRLNCLDSGSSFSDDEHSSSIDKSCLQTFVFVGDLISMAHSIHLTSYQPRLSMYFIAWLPNQLEKLFTCAFHVSMVLALMNSLPVFFLDGESILEVTLLHYFGFLSTKMRRSILRCCLVVGTFMSLCYILQMIFRSVKLM